MKIKQDKTVLLAGLCLLAATFHVQARVTNLNTLAGYDTITGAVAAAASGHVIEVYNGTYDEIVTISTANLTLRVAEGHTATVSPSEALYAIDCTGAGVTIQGFEITGSSVTNGIYAHTGSGIQIKDNTIHDLTTNYYVKAIYANGSDDIVITGNTITNLLVPAYYAMAAYVYNCDRPLFQSNTCHTLETSANASFILFQYCDELRILNNDISMLSCGSVAHTVAIGITDNEQNCSGELIQGNRIYNPSWESYGVVGIDIYYQHNIIVNNNRINTHNATIRVRNNSTNIVVVNNTLENPTDGVWVSIWIPYGIGTTVENNLTLGRVYGVELACSQSVVRVNTVLERHDSNLDGPGYDGNITAPSNTWATNFYARSVANSGEDSGTGLPSPYTCGGAATNKDYSAIQGYWGRNDLPPDQAAIVVGNAADTNSLGERTKITFCTTNGSAAGTSVTNEAYFVHLQADTRSSRQGLPSRQTNSLGSTVQIMHSFAQGEFFATVQLAYDPADVDGLDESSGVDLYYWNAEEYTNQFWQLAVEGNKTNSYFPTNTTQRISGAPTGVLGNYGVDTTDNFVWANVNYTGDFGVFGSLLIPRGTIIRIY